MVTPGTFFVFFVLICLSPSFVVPVGSEVAVKRVLHMKEACMSNMYLIGNFYSKPFGCCNGDR